MTSNPNNPVISLIPYLNALPLTRFFQQQEHNDFDICVDVPAVSCEKLAAGQVDAGLVSSIILPEIPNVNVVNGVCIASEGPVESVLLFSAKPLKKIERIALDPASRTSNVLIQILMSTYVGQTCRFEPGPSEISEALKDFDAVLAIGDRAFQYAMNNPSMVTMDLAMEWKHFTGLPFVFAMWGLKADSPISPSVFREAMTYGIGQFEEIADTFSRKNNLEPLQQKMVYRYLTRNLHYTFGSRERKALFLFYKYAEELGLLERKNDFQFV